MTDTTGAVPIIFSSGSNSPTASFKPIVLIAGQTIRIDGGGGGMVSGFEYDV